ncbi:hypothetical protein [Parasphingorhabdus sp.]|uniref:hypothetical protein n=1 Tax=Parasphingorhabdus sp. TaxID=2709688 RepID=UPI003A955ACD
MIPHKLVRIIFWILLAIILLISLLPEGDAPTVFADDKLNHILAFFTLSVMARVIWPRAQAQTLFIMLIAFGGGIELLQLLLGFGRDADWMDFGADILATGLGIAAGAVFNSIFRKRSVAE